MVREVVLTADLGTGSLRVGAITARGKTVAAAVAAMRTADPDRGTGGVDPEAWWVALARTVGRTLDRLAKGDHVRGLCLTGLTRTQIALDRDGRPLSHALLFRDDRAAPDAAEIARHFPTANRADAITAFHPLARIAWLARTKPRTFDRVHAIVEPKDFLNFRLTGRIAADSVTYSRYDDLRASGGALPEWLDRCVRLLEVPRLAPWRMLGAMSNAQLPWRRLAGIPVFAGAMDTWAAAVGAGAVHAGQGYDIAGTSEAAGLVTPERMRVPGLVSLDWAEKAWQLGGPTQAGADSAAWAHRLLRVRGSLADAVERAGALRPATDRPLFVPYLAGERAPLWRTDVRGVFDGLALAHSGEDLLWAVLEGVAMQMRAILARAVDGSGIRLREVRVAGGGALSSAWCQMKADVMNVPLVRTKGREAGLVGAAMAAAVGLRWHDDLAAAAAAMCPVDRTFEPRSARAEIFARRAERHALARQHALAAADVARDAIGEPGKVVRVRGVRARPAGAGG